jgi:hypothetical protein
MLENILFDVALSLSEVMEELPDKRILLGSLFLINKGISLHKLNFD